MSDPTSVYFADAGYDGQLGRSLAAVYGHAADLGEVLATARRIGRRGTRPSRWHDEWLATADRVSAEADRSRAAGGLVSARHGYLRASEYYRQAFFFLRGKLDDPRLQHAFGRHAETFAAAAALMPVRVDAVRIPYDATTLVGFLCAPDASERPRATVLLPCGYDSTAQAGWFQVPDALARDYNVLLFEGPGQGEALYTQRLFLRPDFEHVVTQVVDWLVDQPGVDPDRLALVGRSFGGYLAPRAATAEHRLAALVCDPPQPDMGDRLPTGLAGRLAGRAVGAMTRLSENKEEFFHARMASHGMHTPQDWFDEVARFTMIDRAADITCPTLLVEADNDFAAGGGEKLFEALTCPKKLVRLTAAEGADGHCGGLGQQVWSRVVYDWLDATMHSSARLDAQSVA